MRRTLVLIPHEIASLPVFGFGWVLIALAVGLAIRLAFAKKTGTSIGNVLANEGLVWGMAIAAVAFVVPRIELQNAYGEPVGLAIRGYGVMLLAAVGSAVYLAAVRAKRYGLDPDVIYSVAPWAFFGGIGGARLFYVIQYHNEFFHGSLGESIGRVLNFTEGGLVVYGSFIGGGLAVAYVLWRRKLPVMKLGDVIVPCMFLGLFFGRMGCIMNGCCYGGRCEEGPMSVRFPPGAKVYADQIGSGELLGFSYDEQTRAITSVKSSSLADQAGVKVGDQLNAIDYDYTPLEVAPRNVPAEDVQKGIALTVNARRIRWSPDELPPLALPVRAAQIISSLSALVMCVSLCWLSRLDFRTGTIMFLGFAAYAVLRFVLEIVRVDEGGQFGTSFSISQWVSIVVLIGSAIGLGGIYFGNQRNASVATTALK
ncbi:prolipoprotein diacylglyceryl transferase [Rubripirellula amarantea]|nr:prolipoprotein diacylglyceryl transferase [Rubripirellula amarantea]